MRSNAARSSLPQIYLLLTLITIPAILFASRFAIGSPKQDGFYPPLPQEPDAVCGTFSNSATITIPSNSIASPQPSEIIVSGIGGVITKVIVAVNSISHTSPGDINLRLVGPSGQNAVIMSDTGNDWPVSGVNLVFDDAAACFPSGAYDGQLQSGTYRPTNTGECLGSVSTASGTLPAPGLAKPSDSLLATFIGTNPNGKWCLYAGNDGSGMGGLFGGWAITIATNDCAGPNTVSMPIPSSSGAVASGLPTVSAPVFTMSLSDGFAVNDQPVTTTFVSPSLNYIGFQADMIYDSAIAAPTPGVVPVVPAGLTGSGWTANGNILNTGPGTLKTLRVSAFSNDGVTPLDGAGTLYLIHWKRVSSVVGASTSLTWGAQLPSLDFEFIDLDLNNVSPPQNNGLITITTGTPTPTATPTPTPIPPGPTPTPVPPTPTPSPLPQLPGIVLVSRLSDAQASAATTFNGSSNPPPRMQTDFFPASLSNSATVSGESGFASGQCTSNSSIEIDNLSGILRVTGNGTDSASVFLASGIGNGAGLATAKLIALQFTLFDFPFSYSLTGQLSASRSTTLPPTSSGATAKLTAGITTVFEVVANAPATVTLSETGILQPGDYTLSVDLSALAGASEANPQSSNASSNANFNFTLGPTPTPTPPPMISISGALVYCPNSSPGPVPGVTLSLSGSSTGSTVTDSLGSYAFSPLTGGGNYTITPSKPGVIPASPGITTVDVIAVQRHYLGIGTALSGCRLTAADVNSDSNVTTVDVIAIQRFYIGLTSGIANVGKYRFNPNSRNYPGVAGNQIDQNYDVLIFGDVASPFAE